MLTVSVTVIIVILIILICCGYFENPSGTCSSGVTEEKFGNLLGLNGAYKVELNDCSNMCNRTDSAGHVFSHSNINCLKECQNKITRKRKLGIPPQKADNNMSNCKKKCSNAPFNQKQKCVNDCYGYNEVKDWCKAMRCPDGDVLCMKQCISTMDANNNQAPWKWGGMT